MRWLGASQVPRMRLLGAGFSWLSRTYVDGDGDGGVAESARPSAPSSSDGVCNRHPDQPYAIWPVQELFVRLFCVRLG